MFFPWDLFLHSSREMYRRPLREMISKCRPASPKEKVICFLLTFRIIFSTFLMGSDRHMSVNVTNLWGDWQSIRNFSKSLLLHLSGLGIFSMSCCDRNTKMLQKYTNTQNANTCLALASSQYTVPQRSVTILPVLLFANRHFWLTSL